MLDEFQLTYGVARTTLFNPLAENDEGGGGKINKITVQLCNR